MLYFIKNNLVFVVEDMIVFVFFGSIFVVFVIDFMFNVFGSFLVGFFGNGDVVVKVFVFDVFGGGVVVVEVVFDEERDEEVG